MSLVRKGLPCRLIALCRNILASMLRVVLLFAFSLVAFGCTTAVNVDKKGSTLGPDRKAMSPGPKGGLIDRDYRLPVTWLEKQQQGPGDYARWLSFGSRKRYYEVHVPQSYQSGRPTPVMLVIHGGGGNPAIIRYQSGMNEVSDRNGFIVVYPAGTGTLFKDRLLHWNSGPKHKKAKQQKVDDVVFIAEVLDDLGKFFSIDSRRVYSTGLSNGAQMSFRLAAELSDRIAAIGPVAGDRMIGRFFGAPPRPVPVISFHGKDDTYLPYQGGEPSDTAFEPVKRRPLEESMAGWIKQAGGDPDDPVISLKGKATLYRYPPKMPSGAEVEFWVLEDGGHTWPGGRVGKVEKRRGVGHINTDISASELIWKFFSRQILPHQSEQVIGR